MDRMQVAPSRGARSLPLWGGRGAALALALLVMQASAAAVPTQAASKTSRLQNQLSQTLHKLQGSKATLGRLTSQTDSAVATLNEVGRKLAAASAYALARERGATAAAAEAEKARVELRRLQAIAARRRREVRVVLQSEQVAGADPLGTLAPFLSGQPLSQAVSEQSEIGMVGASNARKLQAAGQAVIAARREARQLTILAARARKEASQAARARAEVASERAREESLVSNLTLDRAHTAVVVTSLETHAAGLREAIDALLAAARSGHVSSGTLMTLVAAVAAAYHVDPALVWAVVMVESSGNTHATSSTGAQGLMQLEPGTARALGVRNSYNAKDNLMGGASYLSGLIRRYHGNLALAIAAYNMGPGAVSPNGQVPTAARSYVESVLSYWQLGQKRFGSTKKGGKAGG